MNHDLIWQEIRPSPIADQAGNLITVICECGAVAASFDLGTLMAAMFRHRADQEPS